MIMGVLIEGSKHGLLQQFDRPGGVTSSTSFLQPWPLRMNRSKRRQDRRSTDQECLCDYSRLRHEGGRALTFHPVFRKCRQQISSNLLLERRADSRSRWANLVSS